MSDRSEITVPTNLRGTKLKCWWRDGYGGDWCEKDATRTVGIPAKWFCEEHATAHEAGVNPHGADE